MKYLMALPIKNTCSSKLVSIFLFQFRMNEFSMRLISWYVPFQTETALIYDAVHLFAQALHDLDHSQEINTSPLSCDGSETWQHGNSLVNYMKLVSIWFFFVVKCIFSITSKDISKIRITKSKYNWYYTFEPDSEYIEATSICY